MPELNQLIEQLSEQCGSLIERTIHENNELTIIAKREDLLELCNVIKGNAALDFDQLLDVCGVDYLTFGQEEWETENASSSGFSRAADRNPKAPQFKEFGIPQRYAVAYHLLSHSKNWRIRIKVFLSEDDMIIPSVIDHWSCANWFEREAFDLYGILFEGHPDLRRILTDYGFIGHPFRKDFPLVGKVAVRYDHQQGRVVYEPVDIAPRTLVPKLIRNDWHITEQSTSDQEQHNG